MTATVRTTGTTGTDGAAPDLAIVLAPAADPASRPGRKRRPGRHLRPVEPRPAPRPRKKRSPAVPVVVGAGIVIVGLFALAAMHALLIGGQVHLDDLRREQAAEAESVRRLRLEVAELEAPDRVLEVARDRLGMVDPGEVGYLLPVGVPGGEEDLVRVDPATAPPPPPPPPAPEVEPTSPEKQEVDAGLTGPPLTQAEIDAAATGDGATTATGDGTPTTTPTTGVADESGAVPSEGAPDGGGE